MMKNRINIISYDIRARVFWVLVGAFTLSLAIYLYGVLATVHHTAMREALMDETGALAVRVSELEYKDIALRNTVNLDTALSYGFTEVKAPLYVSRSRSSLTLNTQAE